MHVLRLTHDNDWWYDWFDAYYKFQDKVEIFKKTNQWPTLTNKNICSNELKEKIDHCIRTTVLECERVARDPKWDMGVGKQFKVPKVKIRYGQKRIRSNGGRSGISIGAMRYIPADFMEISDKIFHFIEYKAYINDSVIGQFKTTDPFLCLKGTVCHEVAHCIQHTLKTGDRHKRIDYKKPHGRGFRQIYAKLRSEVVNPYI